MLFLTTNVPNNEDTDFKVFTLMLVLIERWDRFIAGGKLCGKQSAIFHCFVFKSDNSRAVCDCNLLTIYCCFVTWLLIGVEPAYFDCHGCGQKSEPSTGHWPGITFITPLSSSDDCPHITELTRWCVAGGGCIHAGRGPLHARRAALFPPRVPVYSWPWNV